ncbi:exo-beta-N-acetylmuramidase NamZ family protein [Thalassotalea agarivorans]|uniref:Uncharacterized conserved protein YbbC, DUF1343 family n=1 Tax=Thalassotalea agarivorans TaxID=349064 RepID=A0A1I0CYQ4_THASX|nr:DUF1343 domain-containing protein [Thalassotalea agarivorans]SET24784.1 Uncharacterized conserved protein YbbC, DUF1343 family [Thalassotalea agarivorans]
MRLSVVFFTIFLSCLAYAQHPSSQKIQTGAEQIQRYLPLLKNKRVGLLVNQTSVIGNRHLVDVLLAHQVNVTTIFAPEHGFRGDHDAGAKVDSSMDAKTGIPIVSIYGKQKKPSAEVMAQMDIVIFDIQDVGLRFYTYISSMHYMMEAAAENGVAFMVLDRPNPNGTFVDGPIREEAFKSFVGMHPIPVLHGMTVAEIANMIVGEKWLQAEKPLRLHTVAMQHYQREMPYSLPIKPSPNLPNDQAIALYPSLCFFEGTPVSIGRGTDFPFQVIGHDSAYVGDFSFTPRSIAGAAKYPKLEGKTLYGEDLRHSSMRGLQLAPLIRWHQAFQQKQLTFFSMPDFFDKLAGTDKLRKAIESGESEAQIKASWQPGLSKFKQMRNKYLLYR